MSTTKLTDDDIKQIVKINGRIRGLILTTLKDYIISKKGIEGLKKVEEKMKEIGYPFSFDGLSSVKWYPAPTVHLVMMVMLEVFNWGEEDNFKMGYEAPINSLLAKLMLRTFTSLEVAFRVTPKFWKNYTNLGEMNWVERDIKNKRAVLRLTNYPKVKRGSYEYFRGYLKKIMEIMTKSKNVKVELTKTIYNGDPYDEFTFTW